jgi:hypothetical protein
MPALALPSEDQGQSARQLSRRPLS